MKSGWKAEKKNQLTPHCKIILPYLFKYVNLIKN